jgi:hypothetical protein
MATIYIQHRVANYDGWKQAFDRDPMGRAQHGVVRHSIHRPVDAPDQVVIQLQLRTREQAETLLTALRAMWARVGSDIGFGPDGVQARILDDVEAMEYPVI